MQLFAGPIQGALSDRFGRRPVILGSTVGLCITSVLMALAPSIGWLFAANVIWGAAAGSLTAAFAYVADVTDPDQRAQRFGLLTAAVSAGGAAGPVIGGFMGEFDARAPFWMAAGLGGISLLYGFFVLPESLPRALRVPLAWRSMHPVGVIRNIWRDHPILKSWQLATFLTSLGTAGINSIGVLYMAFRFGWTPKTIGFYAAFMGVTSIVVQAGLVAKTIRVLGERRALLGGIVVQTLAIGTAGFALWAGNSARRCSSWFSAAWRSPPVSRSSTGSSMRPSAAACRVRTAASSASPGSSRRVSLRLCSQASLARVPKQLKSACRSSSAQR